ncbi:signal protein [Streptomyces milbemycinicus]|uniref:Signal protein n=1 Tax=Streptomyces milbemycinicus TaxID=476552 RepID=A0ABW8LNF1_9ACTN
MSSRTGWIGVAAAAVVAVAGCGGGGGGGSRAAESDRPSEPQRTSAAPSPSAPSPSASSPSAPAAIRLSPADLQGRWWTWAASEETSTNPVADEDGRSCHRNQPDDVWFLAGTFGGQVERTCTVPSGRPVAFPLINLVGDAADCADFMETASGTASLDGRDISPDRYLGTTITGTAAPGNPVTDSSGRFSGTGCGLWVQLPPLKAGKHTLKIRGRSADFTVAVDYALTVAAPSTV